MRTASKHLGSAWRLAERPTCTTKSASAALMLQESLGELAAKAQMTASADVHRETLDSDKPR